MISQRYGGSKILWHYDKMCALRDGKITPPIYVRLKPTNRCNHNCSFCSYDPINGDKSLRDRMQDRSAQLSRSKLLEILEDFKEMGVKAVTYSGGGEPLIHPDISEVMQRTLESGIDLSVITNGQILNGDIASILAKANWVRISSDVTDAESFSRIRRVPEKFFYILTDNIRNFAKIKNTNCQLGINFVVHRDNANQVYKSVEHFKGLGADHIKLTPKWVKNFEEYHKPIKESVLEQIHRAKELSDERFTVYDTYENDFSLSSVSERTYDLCYIMQIVPAIGADGIVYFCHDKAYSSSGVLGSILEQSFKNLWFSEEARQKFFEFNPRMGCKHHCANDSKNILIRGTLNCYGADVNFV